MPRPTATTAPTITKLRITASLLVCRSVLFAYDRELRLPLRVEEVGPPHERPAQMARDRDECRATEQRGSVDEHGAARRYPAPRRDQRCADRARRRQPLSTCAESAIAWARRTGLMPGPTRRPP